MTGKTKKGIKTGKELYKPTSIVNINQEQCEVYVGRPSKYGNPFKEDIDGTKNECIDMYRAWLMKPEQKWILDDILELDGKVLGCHCYPKRCHSEVLIEFILAAKNKNKLNILFE